MSLKHFSIGHPLEQNIENSKEGGNSSYSPSTPSESWLNRIWGVFPAECWSNYMWEHFTV